MTTIEEAKAWLKQKKIQDALKYNMSKKTNEAIQILLKTK